MNLRHMSSLIAASLLLLSPAANAGPFTDDLSRCLVESTTPADKRILVRWMFAAMSRHPAVKSLARVSDRQLDDANRSMAELFVSLLTVKCKVQARKAIKYEGMVALQTSFNVFGRVAGAELFGDPNVVAGIQSLGTYVDRRKEELNSALGVSLK